MWVVDSGSYTVFRLSGIQLCHYICAVCGMWQDYYHLNRSEPHHYYYIPINRRMVHSLDYVLPITVSFIVPVRFFAKDSGRSKIYAHVNVVQCWELWDRTCCYIYMFRNMHYSRLVHLHVHSHGFLCSVKLHDGQCAAQKNGCMIWARSIAWERSKNLYRFHLKLISATCRLWVWTTFPYPNSLSFSQI